MLHRGAKEGKIKIMKFNFRKISAALTSGLMIASGVGFAAAAAFPAPFSDSAASGNAIVYGANAASTDVAAVTNVNDYLASKVKSEGGTPTGGDAVALEKSSDKVDLSNNIATVYGSTVDGEDLKTLLADGVYTNDENTEYDYEQRVSLGAALQYNFFSDSDYEDEALTTGFNLSSSHHVLNYTLNFVDYPASDVSSGDLVDFETTTFNILGKSYFVLDANNGSNVKFTLMDSADSALVSEGETKTMVVGGKSYDVSIEYISTSEVKLKINDQVTNSLAEGGTYKLADGTYVGIKDILARDVAGTVGKVEFSVGSGKLELQNGAKIKLNDDTVNELTGFISRGSMLGNKETITKVVLQWDTDDEAFLTSESELEMPGFKALKLSMENMGEIDKEVVTVKASGSTKMKLTAPIKDGEISIPILYSSSGAFAGIGEAADKQLLTSAGAAGVLWNDSVNSQFVASWNTSRDAETYLLRFNSFTRDSSTGVNYTTVEKWNGDAYQSQCPDRSDSAGSTDCSIGSMTLTLNSISGSGTGTKLVNFTITGGSLNTLYTKEGLKVYLPYQGANNSIANGIINLTTSDTLGHNKTAFYLAMQGDDKDGNLGAGAMINVTIAHQSDNDVEVSTVASGSTQTFTDPEDDDNLVGMTASDVPIQFWRMGPSSSQRYATINYAGEEYYATPYLTAPETTLGSVGNMIFKDSEMESWKTRNVILVGGSCINSATATVLGGAYCADEFESSTGVGAGQFMVASYADKFTAGKIALVVAGYDAADTTAAVANLIAKPETYDTAAGKKYTGTVVAGGSVEVASA